MSSPILEALDTGWPWPLDGVQSWFEDLWNWISDAAMAAVSWVWDQILTWFNAVMGWLDALWTMITGELGKIYTWITVDLPKAVVDAATASAEWLLTQIQAAGELVGDVGKWITGTIYGWIDGLARWLTDSFKWVAEQVGESAGWVKDQVIYALDGGFAALEDTISDALGGIGAAFAEALQDFLDWFVSGLGAVALGVADFLNVNVIKPIHAGLSWVWDWITGVVQDLVTSIEDLIKGESPITPEMAFKTAPKLFALMTAGGLAATGITSVLGLKVLGSGIEVGEIGSFIKDVISPGMVTGAVMGTLIGVGLTTPLRYYYQQAFTPMIPPSADLVTMVVREAFPLEELPKAPKEFEDYMKYQGYSELWSRAYWKSHWVLVDFTTAREYYWRHPEAKEWFMDYLRLLDYNVREREILEELAWQIPPIPDLIRFAVREAYPVVGTEAQYEEMYKWITAKGMERWWGERYFEAHWELPPMTRVFDAYSRGIISEDSFRRYAVIHDYKPEARPGMEASDVDIILGTAYRLIPRVDLRRAWEANLPGYEDLVPHYVKLGYSPEDARDEAALQIRVALGAEISDLEREVERRYLAGFITDDVARRNLEALQFHPLRIESRIQYYRDRAKREHMEADLKEIEDAYVRELIEWPDVEEIAREYIKRDEAREDWLDHVYLRRFKTVRVKAPG